MIAAQLGLLATEATTVLGQAGPEPSTGGQGPEYGKAAPIGLLVVLLLLVAVVLLVRSMNRKLKRLPDSFDPEPDGAPEQERLP